jgi:hypothetical protein
MTIIKALSKQINERIARQCVLVLLDDDGRAMRTWLEEDFGDYPAYKLRLDRWVAPVHTGGDGWTCEIDVRSGQESGSDHGGRRMR